MPRHGNRPGEGAAHSATPKAKKSLSENAALNLLRQPEYELVLLHLAPSGSGHAFYVVPGGGRVKAEDAKKILQRPDVQPYSAGLFPETVQSWRIVRQP